MDEDMRSRLVRRAFKAYCGPDVVYGSCELRGREMTVRYSIPKLGADRTFFVRGLPKTGLSDALWNVATRAGRSAREHAYVTGGQWEADKNRLLQGKLLDEHPRSDAQAGEDGAATPLDPES